jgi:hypothetical protein
LHRRTRGGATIKHLDPVAAPDGFPDPGNPTLWLTVVMSGACPKCRNRLAVIGHGKKPYAASLACTRCRRHRGELTQQETDFINKIISTFGRPTAPIVLRSKPRLPVPSGASPGTDLQLHLEYIKWLMRF